MRERLRALGRSHSWRKDGVVGVRKPSQQERAIYSAESMIAEVAMLSMGGPLVNESMPWGPGSPLSATFGRERKSSVAVLQQDSLVSGVFKMINLWSLLARPVSAAARILPVRLTGNDSSII